MSVFLLGGARSGKSSAAEAAARSLAGESGAEVTVIVTAEPFDEEMTARIEQHRRDRPAGWHTIEAPLDLVAAIETVPPGHVLIVDCVTLWLSNLLVGGVEPGVIEAEGEVLATALGSRVEPSIVVSNEVGLGIVPSDPLTRAFRDVQGRVNAALAVAMERSYLVVAGRLLPLEPPSALRP